MTSRERVLLAINHQEPDRIPLLKPNTIDMQQPFPEKVHHFMDTFGFDAFAGLGGARSPAAKREVASGIFEDGYGCRFEYKGVGLPYCTYSPLAGAQTVDDVEAFNWPESNPRDAIARDVRDRAKAVRERGDYVTSVGVSGMLFHRYHYLRGFEQWMLDIKLDPDIHRAIADHIHRINSTLVMALLDEVGEYVDVVAAGDDFGTSVSSYMSPQDFRQMIKPYYKDLIGGIKERFPHIKFYLHSHGQIMELVPDLIDCGVDILNPVLPLDHMDPVRLKRQFGRQLSFEGGIDIEHVVPFGSVEDVRKHTREVIDIFAPGGGYLFKAQAISPLMPAENVLAAYETAIEYGRYRA